jgi:linoleoyl-CoA desaturase
MILAFINSFHDAVHGALFRTPRYNEWFSFLLELFGSNSWLWQKRHMSLHHAYPNIQDWDIDVRQSDMIRIFPNSPLFNYHKYQHLYMWLIYPMYSLNWIFIRDLKDFFGTENNYVKRIYEIPKIEYFRMIVAKAFNLFYLIGIPMMVLHQPWYIVVAGWLSMHLVGSSLGVIALISTHVDDGAEFPTVPESGVMPTTWAAHQLRVTKDFSPDSKIANFLFGGFTHHVAHHLFPGVAHTYYPAITNVIRRYADQYGLPYTSYPLLRAVASHSRLLRRNGRQNLFITGEL